MIDNFLDAADQRIIGQRRTAGPRTRLMTARAFSNSVIKKVSALEKFEVILNDLLNQFKVNGQFKHEIGFYQ